MMSGRDYSNIIELARKQKYNELKWSKTESLFKITKHLHRSPHSLTEIVPISLVLDIRIKLSCFGRFMKKCNETQVHNFFWNENNLGIETYNYLNLDENEHERWSVNNDFTDNILALLKKAVLTKKVLDYNFFYENLRTLRLTNGPVMITISIRWVSGYRNFFFIDKYGGLFGEVHEIRSSCFGF